MEIPIRVAMAEDHLVLRQGMVALLKKMKGIEVLFDVENGRELLDRLEQEKPDVVLLDIDMPIMDGREALRHIINNYPDVKVIMLTMHYTSGYIISFIKEGASAFLPKQAGIDEIIEAIHSVFNYGFYHSKTVSDTIEVQINMETAQEAKLLKVGLTDREIEILRLLRNGKKNAEISFELNISSRTVEWHRNNLTQKLRFSNMEELLNWSKKNTI